MRTLDADLLAAVRRDDIATVRRLIKAGADANARDDKGETPLHCAARTASLNDDLMSLLIEAGADLQRGNYYGEAPLHLAVKFSSFHTVKWLIDKGAELERETNTGRTPLHYCARYGDLDKAKILVASGADLGANDEDWKMPSDLASVSGSDEVGEFLDDQFINGPKTREQEKELFDDLTAHEKKMKQKARKKVKSAMPTKKKSGRV